MLRGKLCWGAVLVLTIVVFACSDDETAEPVCSPGQRDACLCPDGSLGVHVCLPDGSGWSPCEGCGGAGGSGGVAGAGGSGGASACENGVLDGDESDVDCGGEVCPGCANGRLCNDFSDCVSLYCRQAGAGGGSAGGGTGGAAGGAGGSAGGAAGGVAGSAGAAGGTAGGATGGTGGGGSTQGVCWPCTEDAHCTPAAPNQYCNSQTGICSDTQTKPNGQPCADGTECDSGYCVDDVCCVAPSCGECQACNVPTSEGVCAPINEGMACGDGICDACASGVCEPVTAGQPGPSCDDTNDTDCDGPDSCDGAGNCQDFIESSGTPCGPGIAEPVCNPDTCDGAGTCVDNAVAGAGTVCDTGNPAGHSDCDNGDFCDGAGSCLDDYQPAATACGPGLTEPICNPDVCDAVGNCVDVPEAGPGVTCDTGNPPGDAECDNGDACDGAGSCLDDYETGGTPCGSGVAEPVCDPDACDGAGTCVNNPVAGGGTPCDTGNPAGDAVCDTGDFCDGAGSCQDVFASGGTPCGGAITDPICNPDSCDNSGTCVDNPEAAPGTVCSTGNPAGDADCDNGDFCDGGGHCLDDYVGMFTPCGSGITEPVCNPDSCDGAGTCVDNPEAAPGTVCSTGNPAGHPDCDNGDLCDDAGSCQDVYETGGTPCGPGIAEPVCDPDACDGAGACVDNPVAGPGVVCDTGNPNGHPDCDNGDICDGAGSCQDDYQAGGIPCGPGIAEPVCDPDTCDGGGACVDNPAAGDGTPCGDDLLFCNGDETCTSAACTSDGDPCSLPLACNEWLDVCGDNVWINELHYDNTGGDTLEGIEVAAAAGTDLSGWSLVLYNGNGGATYDTVALSGTVVDQEGGYGTLFFANAGIQNGAPDGVALVNAANEVVQFLSYEGSFAATDGPANGLTAVDIGVSQSGAGPVGFSLQLAGVGQQYSDFAWQDEALKTYLTAPDTGWADLQQCFGTVYGFNVCRTGVSAVGLDFTQAAQFCTAKGPGNHLCTAAEYAVLEAGGGWPIVPWPGGATHGWVDGGQGEEAAQYTGFSQAGALDDWPHGSGTGFATCCKVPVDETCTGTSVGTACYQGAGVAGGGAKAAAVACDAQGFRLCTAAEARAFCDAGVLPDVADTEHFWVDGSEGDTNFEWPGLLDANHSTNACDVASWPESDGTGIPLCCQTTSFRGHPDLCAAAGGSLHNGVCLAGLLPAVDYSGYVAGCFGLAPGTRPCSTAEGRLACVDGAFAGATVWVDGGEGNTNLEWIHLLNDCSNSDAPDSSVLSGACCL